MNYNLLDTKNNEGNTPLYLAVVKASTVCIMLLLKHRANLLIENNLFNSSISACIASNHLNLLITFLHQPIDIDLSKLYTESDEYRIKEKLPLDCWIWKYGIKLNSKTIERYSLIHLIIQRNWQGALSLIFDELDRFHLKYIQVFVAAILNNRFNLVLRLLSTIKNRNILNEKNSNEQNLFHIIANIQQYDKKILHHLHDKQVEWNIQDKYGSYPLHYACVMQNKSLIEFLLNKYSNQVNFYQTDSFNNTAYGLLFWSLSTIDKQFIQRLITSEKSLDCLCNYQNENSINPLSFGYINSNSISYPPIKSESNLIRTSPLINAIVHENFELTKFILHLGADVNFPDEEQRTPLMHAVRKVK